MDAQLPEILQRGFFELVPFNVAVIDKSFNVLIANENFKSYFGNWQGRRCFEICKKTDRPCSHCRVKEVFETGEVRVSNESGIDINDKPCHYVVHLAPLKNDKGEVEYILEMSLDVTDTTHWQREYNILFERVPCYISIIDKDFRIIRANEKFRDTFGDSQGKYCFNVYKKRKKMCKLCPAALTFEDGKEHASTQIGRTKEGDIAHYIVQTTPLSKTEEGVQLVMEICTDITEITNLQEQLTQAHDFYATLIENSADGIMAVDTHGKTQIFNKAARDLLNWEYDRKPGKGRIKELLPEVFFEENTVEEDNDYENDTFIKTIDGEDIPVRFHSVELRSKKQILGKAAFMQDLRKIRQLEKQRLDAERLGAVGQTVAGLAHTIKNLLMGLEGGIYMVDTGLRKGDASRILDGWEVLQRNFNKTTTLVKDFLSFSKGRLPELKLIDPMTLVEDIVELYADAAMKQGVELKNESVTDVKPALLDPDGMEACLTNLLSNGIDAAIMRENGNKVVIVRTYDKDDILYFEVEDNGAGMDSEVIQKIFTTFFTTKGNKGTGLGLLTTRKIIQEHGGTIDVSSDKGKGSIFKISLPRYRLKMIAEESYKSSLNKK